MNLTTGRNRRQRHKRVAGGGSILRARAAFAASVSCYGVQRQGMLGHRAPHRRSRRCISSISFQKLAQTHGNASQCCKLFATTVIMMLHCLRAMGKAHLSHQLGKHLTPRVTMLIGSLGSARYWGTASGTGAMPSTGCSSAMPENIAPGFLGSHCPL